MVLTTLDSLTFFHCSYHSFQFENGEPSVVGEGDTFTSGFQWSS